MEQSIFYLILILIALFILGIVPFKLNEIQKDTYGESIASGIWSFILIVSWVVVFFTIGEDINLFFLLLTVGLNFIGVFIVYGRAKKLHADKMDFVKAIYIQITAPIWVLLILGMASTIIKGISRRR